MSFLIKIYTSFLIFKERHCGGGSEYPLQLVERERLRIVRFGPHVNGRKAHQQERFYPSRESDGRPVTGVTPIFSAPR